MYALLLIFIKLSIAAMCAAHAEKYTNQFGVLITGFFVYSLAVTVNILYAAMTYIFIFIAYKILHKMNII
jgi:hypothetical protein